MNAISKAVASMSGDSAKDDVQEASLTERQEKRMREVFPIAYTEHINGRRSSSVNDVMNKVIEKFPEHLQGKMIYHDVSDDGLSINKYKDKWFTYVSGKYGIVWAYDGRETYYLAHFVNGIFDVGIMLDALMVRALYMLHLTGTEQSPHSVYDGEDTGFKCEKEEDAYVIYMHDSKIMTLEEDLMNELSCGINDRIPVVDKHLNQLLKTWITV